jgi:hypothetical protein
MLRSKKWHSTLPEACGQGWKHTFDPLTVVSPLSPLCLSKQLSTKPLLAMTPGRWQVNMANFHSSPLIFPDHIWPSMPPFTQHPTPVASTKDLVLFRAIISLIFLWILEISSVNRNDQLPFVLRHLHCLPHPLPPHSPT